MAHHVAPGRHSEAGGFFSGRYSAEVLGVVPRPYADKLHNVEGEPWDAAEQKHCHDGVQHSGKEFNQLKCGVCMLTGDETLNRVCWIVGFHWEKNI